MKKLLLVLLVLTCILTLGAAIRPFPASDNNLVLIRTTFVASATDTLTYNRPAKLAALGLSYVAYDSITVTNVIVRRIYNGQLLAVQVGDTLTGLAATVTTSGDPTTVKYSGVSLTPLCDGFIFYVAIGANAGTSLNNIVYTVEQQFYK